MEVDAQHCLGQVYPHKVAMEAEEATCHEEEAMGFAAQELRNEPGAGIKVQAVEYLQANSISQSCPYKCKPLTEVSIKTFQDIS